MKYVLVFTAGMVAAGALNQVRWAIWPMSGGPYLGDPTNPRTPQLFGWLGGPPGYGRPTGPTYYAAR